MENFVTVLDQSGKQKPLAGIELYLNGRKIASRPYSCDIVQPYFRRNRSHARMITEIGHDPSSISEAGSSKRASWASKDGCLPPTTRLGAPVVLVFFRGTNSRDTQHVQYGLSARMQAWETCSHVTTAVSPERSQVSDAQEC
eukprot:scaffold121991_cov30-Tisochrysis_lutea.AAC.4